MIIISIYKWTVQKLFLMSVHITIVNRFYISIHFRAPSQFLPDRGQDDVRPKCLKKTKQFTFLDMHHVNSSEHEHKNV